MNELQVKIQERSKVWADCWCCETTNNGGNCIDDLTMKFTGHRPWRVSYCAMAAYVIYAEACGELGMKPLLPKKAGAQIFLDSARAHPILKNFISSDPIVGAQFYRRSSLQGKKSGSETTGHVGTVYQITDKRIITFEGNSSQQIHFVSYSLDAVYDKARGFAFIHACLAPHEADLRMVEIMPGVPMLIPWKEKAEPPASCRSNPRCKPKNAV
ncbi:MAG: hypothetical protein ABI876_08390 [Bacteroidota bacterium]